MLNAGAIKEMTGGNSMFTRGLYDDGAEMTCTFCPILLCNDMPNCNDQSEGMGRRQAVINFPVQFKQFPDPKKYPYEKKLDESIDQMIEEHADLSLTWCLTNGYEYAQKTGVQYPKSVQESTNIYKKDCDLIAQFKDEFIVKTFLTTDKLRWNTVLNAYTRYYKSHHTGRLPRVVDLRRSFVKALGEPLHNYEWAGWLMPTPCTSGF
jgi:putative DNA primase/helicase